MANKILNCFCCGAEITAPQFYKGRAYGWTCITKVSDQKRTRTKDVWIPVDSIELITLENRSQKCVAELNGLKYVETAYPNREGVYLFRNFAPESKLMRIYAQHQKRYGNKYLADFTFRGLKRYVDENGIGRLVLDRNKNVIYEFPLQKRK